MERLVKMMTELSIIEEVAKSLSLFGNAEIVYLTAEFAPFSNQQRPDLLFRSGSVFAGRPIFVEFKNPRHVSIMSLRAQIFEHRDFVRESVGEDIVYVYSTPYKLDKQAIDIIGNDDIILIDEVVESADLVTAILDIVKEQ
jgi:hypothetical protein